MMQPHDRDDWVWRKVITASERRHDGEALFAILGWGFVMAAVLLSLLLVL